MLVSNNIINHIVPDIKIEMLVDKNLFVGIQSLLNNFKNYPATHGVQVGWFGVMDWKLGFYERLVSR